MGSQISDFRDFGESPGFQEVILKQIFCAAAQSKEKNTIITWCEALSSISPDMTALRAKIRGSTFRITLMTLPLKLKTIALGDQGSIFQQIQLIFKESFCRLEFGSGKQKCQNLLRNDFV